MKYTESFIFTMREDPKIADCLSHKFLLKGSYLSMIASGIYAYLPLGLRVLSNVENIIRKHMNAAGAQEMLMSALQPIELWQATGRDQDLKEIMFKFKDRKDRDLCLGPTHEEEVTDIASRFVNSYKQLPFTLYQIQGKFRDEPRPRFGLMRSAEFIMKDAYSFDSDEEGLDINYEKMKKAYQNIFTDCGLKYVMSAADSGVMGGKVSHEFMVEADIGEDVLYHCALCDDYVRETGACPKCHANLVEKKMVEIGHIFKLGTKYTVAQKAQFLDAQGKQQPIIMGCYGIGVSRLLPAIVQTNHDEKGIIWPKRVGPFEVIIAVLEDKFIIEALELANTLEKMGLTVLVDDRPCGAGVKFNDVSLIGSPYVIVMGKNYAATSKLDIEIRARKDKKALTKDEVLSFFKVEYGL
jgi:prolyl-tRNA synthetase